MQEIDLKYILSVIPGLDAEYAVQATGCSFELYMKLLAQIVRLTPSNIADMDEYIRMDDLESFRVKIHGVKGSLRQASYSALAKRAQDLENAAKAGDIRHCVKHYPAFRSELINFSKNAQEALILAKKSAPQPDGISDISEHLPVLHKIAAALEDCDIMTATELLEPIACMQFGGGADELIAKTKEQLELFSPEEAAEQLNKLIDLCT